MTRHSRLVALAEQITNSGTSLLLTLVMASLLAPAQFGAVTYILTVLQFVSFALDSVLGSAIIFDERRGAATRILRRSALIGATLIAGAAVYCVMLPVWLPFSPTLAAATASLGGLRVIAPALALYCLALSGFEQLRRTSYAIDAAPRLLAVNILRLVTLGLLVLLLRKTGLKVSIRFAYFIVTGVLLFAIQILARRLIDSGQLASRARSLPTQYRYIVRTVRTFSANAGATIAYSALELMLLSGMIAYGQPEAVARYRGLQIAMLAVNLLATATENSNASRNAIASDDANLRFRQSVTFLLAGGAVAVIGFLMVGKPVIALLLGPTLVPSPFEMGCGAGLMVAQLLRTPFAILLKFAGQFNLMFRVYAFAALGEFVLLAILFKTGHQTYGLAALTLAHFATTAALAWKGYPLMDAALITKQEPPILNFQDVVLKYRRCLRHE